MSLAKRFFLNTAALAGSRLIVMLSQILVLPIIAQYLTVEDFGAVALAMTVVVFAQLLSDAGVGRSLIRQKHLDSAEWNTVFWFLALLGVVLMLILQAVAPYAASFFNAPITGPLISALSIVPLFLALSAVSAARMERDGAFPQLAFIQLTSAVLGILVAIWFAVTGAGAWALIAQQITIACVSFLLICCVSDHEISLPRNFSNIKKHLRFGRDSIGVAFVFTAQRQVPIMLIGYFLGQIPLGLYAMSQRILNLPQQALAGPFAQVAYVRMTNLQDKAGAMGEVYIMTIRVLAFIVFPPMIILTAVAPDLFALLLSEPWRSAGTIYALCAFGIALECATSTAGVMFQAADKTTLRLKMATERTLLRILAALIAVPFGIEAVSLSVTIFACLYVFRYFSYAQRADYFSKEKAVSAMLPAVIVSFIATALLFVWNQVYDNTSGLLLVSATLVALTIAWVILGVLQFQKLRSGLSVLGK